MSHVEEDDSLPVLNAVVESGNESIIQSSRLGREVLRELEMLQASDPVKFVLHDHLLDEQLSNRPGEQHDNPDGSDQESQTDLSAGGLGTFNVSTSNSDDEIEHMIDQVVDRHIHELRRDIRRLLMRVKQNT